MSKTSRLALAVPAGLLLTTLAWAGPDWPEFDDAGSLPGGSQATRGNGPIESIAGNLGLGLNGLDLEDMFTIRIPDPTVFSATTVTAGGPAGTTFDAQLFLFDADGLGALGNDEAPCPLSGPDDGPPVPPPGGPCDIVCEPGDLIELEPCGDNTNGGCDEPAMPFEPIGCGETICGTAWADMGARDTDWFLFTVTDACVRVTATLQSEFSGVVAIIPIPDCSGGLGQAGASNACTSFQPAQAILGPGEYAVFVAPAEFDGLPCGTENDYRVSLECEVIQGASRIFPGPMAPPIEPGIYYLAITVAGNNPVSACGLIFDLMPNEVGGPDGPGGDLPIISWLETGGSGTGGDQSSYIIMLEGAEFAEQDLCPGDVNDDRTVDVVDLIEVILNWGSVGFTSADVNGDGIVDVEDLVQVILAWGACPQGTCPGDGGDCFAGNGTPGCDDVDCCQEVCSVDPFCCDSEWDGACAAEAGQRCIPGACCLLDFCVPSGICVEGVILADCIAQGGVFQGPGTVCTEKLCLCEIICEPGDLLEFEACGDDVNGGCNSTPPIFGAIACGDAMCGIAFADGGFRDTDWYLLNVTAITTVTAEFFSEFPGVIFIVDGIDTCSPVVVGAGDSDNCVPGAVATADLNPGDYVIFVATADFDGSPCGTRNDYRFVVGCDDPGEQCELACEPDDTSELEVCGADANGGCNSTPPVFQSITCGETVCGTAWADGGTRDTDWYELDITEPTIVTITLESEFPGIVFLLDLVECAGPPGISETTADCVPSPPLIARLEPGVYQIVVGTQGFDGFPCGTSNDYRVTLDCGP